MTKQVVNIGTSANKGDGDPLRTAFRKINENFDEVYSDVKQLNSVNFGGGTITSDIIGTVSGTDSTMLVDGNNSKVVGPIESSTWTRPTGDIEIEATADNVVIEAGTTVTMQHVSAQDYVQVSNNGTVIYSDSSIQLKTAGQDIQIGYDVASGDVQIGHSSSQLFVNGTLTVNEFAKIVPPDYDTVARDGLAGLSDGSLIFNTDSNNLEMYVGGVWKNATATDIGDLTDNGSLIPADVSDLTDTTNIIPADVSDLTDTTSIIPNDIGDLLAGGNTGDVVTKTAIGYGWTAPNYFGGAFSDLTSTPTTLAGYGITDAVALTGLSVSTASAGTAALAYNNLTGAFTFTPPDLSSYLTSYTETDPVVGAITGIVKADGAGNISAAVAGTDYLASVAFGDLTSTPTTLVGYGITDAATLNNMAPTGAVDFTGATSVDFTGTTITALDSSGLTKPIDLDDNEEVRFGTDNDMRIYHSGTTGNIDNNTGTLIISGPTVRIQDGALANTAISASNGVATLLFENSTKLETTTNGVTITGDTAVSGNLTAGTGTVGGLTFAGTQIASDDSTQISFQDNIEIAGGPVISGFNLSHTGTFTINPYALNLTTTGGNVHVQASNYVILDSTNNGQINIGQASGSGDVLIGNESNGTSISLGGHTRIEAGVEESYNALTGQSGVVAHDCSDGYMFYHTSTAGDITANFTNLSLASGHATNLTIVIDQGNTAHEITAVQIGGAAQTIVWQNNNAPTGTANGVDSFSFTILNDGGSYVVLGQMVSFGGV